MIPVSGYRIESTEAQNPKLEIATSMLPWLLSTRRRNKLIDSSHLAPRGISYAAVAHWLKSKNCSYSTAVIGVARNENPPPWCSYAEYHRWKRSEPAVPFTRHKNSLRTSHSSTALVISPVQGTTLRFASSASSPMKLPAPMTCGCG